MVLRATLTAMALIAVYYGFQAGFEVHEWYPQLTWPQSGWQFVFVNKLFIALAIGNVLLLVLCYFFALIAFKQTPGSSEVTFVVENLSSTIALVLLALVYGMAFGRIDVAEIMTSGSFALFVMPALAIALVLVQNALSKEG
jgi:cellulose synthase/poly-beta-1,6-N-acetylglucosamine synthase-like glycosyltransferase